MFTRSTLTVLGLEPGVTYRSYFWDPSTGAKVDLGDIRRADPGDIIYTDTFTDGRHASWLGLKSGSARRAGQLSCKEQTLMTVKDVSAADLRAAIDMRSDADAALVLRYKDADNYVAAVYSSTEKVISIRERKQGVQSAPKGQTSAAELGAEARLLAEINDGVAVVSIADERRTYTSPIVPVEQKESGSVGLSCAADGTAQLFENFEVRSSPPLVADDTLQRDIYDAAGAHRGRLGNPASSGSEAEAAWNDYGRRKTLLLDAYQPPRPPFVGDWLLILDATRAPQMSANPGR